MQSHISYVVLPVDVIEGDLNSLSPGSYRFEDLLDLVRLLFNDASESSIAARYSEVVQNCEDSFGHSARVQVICEERLNLISSTASKESRNTDDCVPTLSADFGF